MELRTYQKEAIQKVREAYISGNKSILVVSPTGSGKGVILSEIIKSANDKGKRVLFLVHRREILFQVSAYMDRYEIPHGVILSGEEYTGGNLVELATIQTLRSRMKNRYYAAADVIIVDECFTGDTLISTPTGEKRIDTLRCGDIVYNQTGIGKVDSVFAKNATELFKLELSDGNKIRCTGDHPIFTRKGWTKARELEKGEILYGIKEMRILWEDVFPSDNNGGKDMEASKILLGIVCKEIREPNEQQSICGENEEDTAQDWTQTYKAWGERAITTFASFGTTSRPRCGVGSGAHCSSEEREAKRLSNMLQDRHSKPSHDDRNRSGRANTRREKSTGCGCKEDTVSGGVRLDNISRIERESPEPVYNLRINGHPSYFAGGIAVHNCHNSTSDTYWHAIRELQGDILIGFTATPCRQSGRGLGKLYQTLVNVATIDELTKDGYLVPIKYYAPSEPDLSEVKVTGGDYNGKQLDKVMRQPKLIGDIIENWVRLADKRQTIVFTTTVAHSVAVCDAFIEVGIPAEHLDGTTDKEERGGILSRFRSGDTRIICNCQVLTEGVDIPDISCVVMARPTKSLSLYMQTIGRGMRPAPGKEDLYYIDHAGACYEHGPVCDITDWTLDEKTKNGSKKNEERKKKESKPLTCQNCSLLYQGQIKCPQCGTIPDKNTYGKDVEYIDYELGEVCFKTKQVKVKASMEDKQEWFSQLLGYAATKGFNSGYASHKYRAKFGVWPNKLEKTRSNPKTEVLAWVRGEAARAAIAKKYQEAKNA